MGIFQQTKGSLPVQQIGIVPGVRWTISTTTMRQSRSASGQWQNAVNSYCDADAENQVALPAVAAGIDGLQLHSHHGTAMP